MIRGLKGVLLIVVLIALIQTAGAVNELLPLDASAQNIAHPVLDDTSVDSEIESIQLEANIRYVNEAFSLTTAGPFLDSEGNPIEGLTALLMVSTDEISWNEMARDTTDSSGYPHWGPLVISQPGRYYFKTYTYEGGYSVGTLVMDFILPPVARFDMKSYVDPNAKRAPWGSSDPVPMIGGVIEFDASNSQGDIVEYQWTFGDGKSLTRIVGEGDEGFGWAIAHHIYKSEDTFTVTLQVKDSKGTLSDPKVKSYTIPKLKPGDIIFCNTLGYEFIPGFFSHCGLYIGNGKIAEAVYGAGHGLTKNTVGVSNIRTWFNPYETCVAVYRVKPSRASAEIKQKAIQFAKSAANQDPHYTYDMKSILNYQKQQKDTRYYCSELVWAAYSVASGGEYMQLPGGRWEDLKFGKVNLGRTHTSETAVTPSKIAQDSMNVKYVASHWEVEPAH